MATIPLAEAMFCPDCDVLFRANAQGQCPTCLGRAGQYLTLWLNRPEVKIPGMTEDKDWATKVVLEGDSDGQG